MSLLTTAILDSSQLKRLGEHKYSSHGSSITEAVMQPFWKWLIEKVPRSIAPNTMTLSGLILNIISAVILMLYCPTAKEEAPRWAYFFCGICLFIYQTLDALDGKQARRTNSSTPLGELFDHGCDAVSAVFVSISTSVTLQLGVHPFECFFLCFVGLALFYTAHWQTYVSGTLRFGKFDVTETQVSIIFCLIITSFFGPAMWSYQIHGYRISFLLLIFSTFMSLLSFQKSFEVIFGGGGSGRNGSTVAGTSVLSPMMHFTAVVLLAVMVMQRSPTQLYQNNCCLFILMFGMVSAKITNKLIVAHMTKSGMDFADTTFLGPLMLFLNQYLGLPISNESLVLWAAMVSIPIKNHIDRIDI
ncbi:choline/ethanolaminephosphotransferase 1-like [Anneissia japonica]|uniref:choline/ethanolaminephosphotransferase 1-like n=1 Tax=Anneissia japonica TaxID=1529436 RepID=UPI0014256D0C|nr:choline/ethanolaminephosphotransferase 1-like [Anneissia japonica]